MSIGRAAEMLLNGPEQCIEVGDVDQLQAWVISFCRFMEEHEATIKRHTAMLDQ